MSKMFNAPCQQRISSMAVENLPVFNSVSKDKLMNIATQVYTSYYLFSDTLVSFFVNSFWKGTRLDRQSEKLLNEKSSAANIETILTWRIDLIKFSMLVIFDISICHE